VVDSGGWNRDEEGKGGLWWTVGVVIAMREGKEAVEDSGNEIMLWRRTRS
jgi:hypothetical protein